MNIRKLLLTTALVSCAMPAFATISYDETTKTHYYEDAVVQNKFNEDNGGVLKVGTNESLYAEDVTFKNNTSALQGGAIVIGTKAKNVTVEDAHFIGNKGDTGGAIANFNKLTVIESIFDGNTATAELYDNGGGALFLGATSSSQIISDSVFKNNISNTKGGAIATREGTYGSSKRDLKKAYLTISADFINNKATTDGGAIHNYFYAGDNGVEVTGEFTSNSAGNNGGAIYNDGTVDKNKANAKMTITNSEFTSNTAGNYGGAIYNDGKTDKNGIGAKLTVVDGTFTSNIAAEGAAIYNAEKAVLNLNGKNVFSENKTTSGAFNDIHNDGTVTVSGDLTLEGGITGNGSLTFESGSNLTVVTNKTIISNDITNNGANLNLLFDTAFSGDYILVTSDGSLNTEFTIVENSLYNINTTNTLGTYNISQKSADEVSENLGLSSGEADILVKVTGEASDNSGAFNEVSSNLNIAAQKGDPSIAKELAKLGANSNPIVIAQELSNQEMLFGAVANELNGTGKALAQGQSSGDYLNKATAWIRGLFNKAEQERTSKASGFKSEAYGIAMGIDKEINSDTRLGFGYAYLQTDIDSQDRMTKVDSNSLFAYAKYQPANWYVNTMLSYSLSKYEEDKDVTAVKSDANFDVNTFALHTMFGYETQVKGHDVTPEFGVRYMRLDQEKYTDKLRTVISSNQEDIITFTASTKIAKDYTLECGMVVRPEVGVAVTYDLVDTNDKASVLLANNAAYTVEVEEFNKLGFEFGANVSAFATDKVELSANYLTKLRKDFQNHTVSFNVKYNF